MTVEDTVPVFMILGTIRKQLTACHYTDKTKRRVTSLATLLFRPSIVGQNPQYLSPLPQLL